MSDSNNMRKYLNLLEKDLPYTGPRNSPEIQYSASGTTKDGITKVVAKLSGSWSGKYTKLVRNLIRLERIEERVKQIKEEVKQDSREMVADLFHAEDAARTRLVETVSVIMKITKDPKASVTYKYSQAMEEFQTHLTPELISVWEGILAKYETTTQKPPAVATLQDKNPKEEGITEGAWDGIKNMLRAFRNKVEAWGQRYDDKLERVQQMIAMGESSLAERYAALNEGAGVHEFSDSGEAYDACQCDDTIKDGDTLICGDGVVGLAWTYPLAVTQEAGNLHFPKSTEGTNRLLADAGISEQQVRAAIEAAKAKGLEIRPEFAAYDDEQTVQEFTEEDMIENLDEAQPTPLDGGRGDADIKWGSLIGNMFNFDRHKRYRRTQSDAEWRRRQKTKQSHGGRPGMAGSTEGGIHGVGDTVHYTVNGRQRRGQVTGVEQKHGDTRYSLRSGGFVYHSDLDEHIIENNPLGEDWDDFDTDAGDWYEPDDLQTHNDNEADDYRNEGDDEPSIDPDLTTYSPEEAVQAAIQMLRDTDTPLDNETLEQVRDLERTLNRYADLYSISPHKGNDNVWEFDVADSDNVNFNFNPMAKAWFDENGRFRWSED